MTDEDENHDFAVDYGFKPPEPFDRAVANLDMRCMSNSVSTGMKLAITASFGSDVVEISLSDGGKLEVMCEIYKAMVIARPYHCEFVDIEVEGASDGFAYKQTFSDSRASSSVVSSSFGVKASGGNQNFLAKADAEVSASKSSDKNTEGKFCLSGEREFPQVQFGLDQITIHKNPDGAPLEGNLVDRTTCFHVVPNSSVKPFGVLAQLGSGPIDFRPAA